MLVLLLVLSSQTVWANSSWVWLTDRQPYQLLPAAAALTVLIETVMIKTCLGIQKTGKVLAVVLAGNLISFLIPYLFVYLDGADVVHRTSLVKISQCDVAVLLVNAHRCDGGGDLLDQRQPFLLIAFICPVDHVL